MWSTRYPIALYLRYSNTLWGFTALQEAFCKFRGTYRPSFPQDLPARHYFQGKAAQAEHQLGTATSTGFQQGQGEAEAPAAARAHLEHRAA